MPTVDSATAILIRVPADLKKWVEREAAENDRSMSAEVRRMIEDARRWREHSRQGVRDYGISA